MIRRRDLFLVATATGIATAIGATSLAATPRSAFAARRDKRKGQYQASSPEVQTFYRVNRYPAK